MGSQIFHFQFQAPPFKLSSAPHIFSKGLGRSTGSVEVKSDCNHPLFGQPPNGGRIIPEPRGRSPDRTGLPTVAGLVNREKSSLILAQRVTYLGYEICLIKSDFPPARKNLKDSSADFSLADQSLDLAQKNLKSSRSDDLLLSAVPWARLHQRPLQRFLLRNWDGYTSSLEMRVWIPSRIKRSLWQWRSQPHLTKGLQWSIPISQRITTDASFWGWGAHLKQHSSTGKMVPQGSKGFIKSEGASGGTKSLGSILKQMSGVTICRFQSTTLLLLYTSTNKEEREVGSINLQPRGSYHGRKGIWPSITAVHLKMNAKLPGRLSQPLPGVSRQLVPPPGGFCRTYLRMRISRSRSFCKSEHARQRSSFP